MDLSGAVRIHLFERMLRVCRGPIAGPLSGRTLANGRAVFWSKKGSPTNVSSLSCNKSLVTSS